MNGFVYCSEHIEEQLTEAGHIPTVEVGKKIEVENVIKAMAKDSLIALSSIKPVGNNKEEWHCCTNMDAVFEFRYMIIPEDRIEGFGITEDTVYSHLYEIANDYIAPSPESNASEVACDLPTWDNTNDVLNTYVKRNVSLKTRWLRIKMETYAKVYGLMERIARHIRGKFYDTEKNLIEETNKLHGYGVNEHPLIKGVR